MRSRTLRSFLPLAAAGLASLAAAQTTTRVSVSSTGVQATGDSSTASVSNDGDVISFTSLATNLVAGDTNGNYDVFVHVRSTNTTTRVSVSSAGAQSNGASGAYWGSEVTADGKLIAFESTGTNLVAADTNAATDVFLHDRLAATTSRVSLTSSGFQANGASTFQDISSNGRYLLFDSQATNLVAGDTNALGDTFVRDLHTGATVRVSITSSGGQPEVGTDGEAVSEDGRWATFATQATNVVPNDANGNWVDVFLRDLVNGTTAVASVSTGGVQGNHQSYASTLSSDGRYIAFQSYSTNLVPGDTNGTWDLFLRDRVAATTTRISMFPGGVQSGATCAGAKFAANDRYLAFWSWGSMGVVWDPNNAIDVFAHDLVTGENTCVSVGTSGASTGSNTSIYPAISANGRWIAFESRATNLVTGDTNNRQDIFVRDWPKCIAPGGADCNQNGMHDACDIDDGVSQDVNLNGMPDECETPACELAWLYPSQAGDGDRFGLFLDTDGSNVIVGASGDDHSAGVDQGSAWVWFRWSANLTPEWKLSASDAAAGDAFGSSVAIQGDWAVVGAPGCDGLGSESGAVYVFHRPNLGFWQQMTKLQGSDTNAADAFGTTLAWVGDLLFVGAPTKETPQGAARGVVYVFGWNGAAFTQLASLHAADGLANDRFGSSIDYDDDRLAIGAFLADTTNGVDSGAAYVYRRNGGAWMFEQKLQGRAPGSFAGKSVSIEDEWLALGQPQDNFAGTTAGLVHLWQRDSSTNVWTLAAELLGPDTDTNDYFGHAVQLEGTHLFVGAPFRNWHPSHEAGEVYVFNHAAGQWFDTERLRPSSPSNYLIYGYSLAYDSGLLAVGASGDDSFGPPDSGSAYVYGVLGADCDQNLHCDLCDIRTGQQPDDNYNAVPDPCDIEQFCFCAAGPCANSDATAGCASSLGSGALMAHSGSLSVTSDDLVLTTSNMPANMLSIMFMSASTAASPLAFYDGRRCLLAPIYRFATSNSGALGVLDYGPGLAGISVARFGPSGWIQSGRTFAFQVWYRDPSGPCGTGGNLSNGVKATFTP